MPELPDLLGLSSMWSDALVGACRNVSTANAASDLEEVVQHSRSASRAEHGEVGQTLLVGLSKNKLRTTKVQHGKTSMAGISNTKVKTAEVSAKKDTHSGVRRSFDNGSDDWFQRVSSLYQFDVLGSLDTSPGSSIHQKDDWFRQVSRLHQV